MKIAIGRTCYFVASLTFGILAGVWGQPLIHGNSDAVNVIVTVFSILSGFLVAVITIIGDPSVAASRDRWRFSELHRDNVRRRLTRNKWLFVLYLVTVSLVFLAALVKNIPSIVLWVERAYLCLAVLAFCQSYKLPWALANIQMRRYDDIIEDQRKSCGIDKESDPILKADP
jgi:hypothetical protein